MITLAKKRFDLEMKSRNTRKNINRSDKKHELLYLKGSLHFDEGDYKKSLLYLTQSNHSSARYLKVLAHIKNNELHNARAALESYLEHVETWHECDEKEFALERVQELATMLLP